MHERIIRLFAGTTIDAHAREIQARQDLLLAEAHKTELSLRAQLSALEAALAERDQQLLQNQSARDNLSAQIDELHRIVDYLQHRVTAICASRSWRLTQPLREAKNAARLMGALPQSGLRALNRASQVTHQRLKRTHPHTAEFLRRAIGPLMARANLRLLGQHSVPAPPGPSAPNPAGLSEGGFAFDYQRLQVFSAWRPLVTVIVPNYNHAPYLARRLESIFAQSYDHYEVLLLDDCSTDDSRAVLRDFAARHPDRTRLLFNEENSGGVFRQWEKGLAAARGELIWIAESDDWASPNFLETLVPFFQNEAVQLACARTVFMDAAGENQTWSMEEYLHAFGPERWSRAWIETAPTIVREVFSMANIVPNASGALFRRFDRMDALEIERWRDMRTCGDWMFYLNVIRGGMMAYSPDAQNFYRIHERNTSTASHQADPFYREHEAVAKCVRRHYRVPDENLARLGANLRHHWKVTRADYSDAAFATCFDPARIMAEPPRRPGLLMAGYGFCSGGGETFPIQLANEMKALGYEVTYLDCGQEPRVPGIRAMLAADIPVVSHVTDLHRIVENFDIEVVHSHHGWVDNMVLDLLPADSPARTVVTLHGFYETVPPEIRARQLPRLLARSDAMVYIAEKNLAPMKECPGSDRPIFHRIDNAVSRRTIAPVARAALEIPEDAFLLVLASRALHAKGWAEAIAATGRAREISRRDIRLVLVGEGEARDAAEAAGVPPHVRLEGFRPNPQDYFAAADLGLLPSRFPGESFPLVVIECLNAGTPVLASDIGEIRNMLTTDEGPAGALFALGPDWTIDIEALARQIAALAGDPAGMARLRARVPAAAARFDPRRMAERYDAVYTGQSAGQPRFRPGMGENRSMLNIDRYVYPAVPSSPSYEDSVT